MHFKSLRLHNTEPTKEERAIAKCILVGYTLLALALIALPVITGAHWSLSLIIVIYLGIHHIQIKKHVKCRTSESVREVEEEFFQIRMLDIFKRTVKAIFIFLTLFYFVLSIGLINAGIEHFSEQEINDAWDSLKVYSIICIYFVIWLAKCLHSQLQKFKNWMNANLIESWVLFL